MVDRFIAGGSVRAADQGIGGIITKGDPTCPLDATEVVPDGFADEHRQWDPPAARLILKLPVRVLRKPEIRRHVFGHGGITVSRHRSIVNYEEHPPGRPPG